MHPRGQDMFLRHPIGGISLPAGTLSLTFDDSPGRTEGPGPGPRTLEIARFLYDRGIQATFFVSGMHAEIHTDLLAEIRALGHLLGNHAFHHVNLVDLLAAGGDVAGQVLQTDTLIRRHLEGPTAYFRAPYGAWTAKLAQALNANCLASLGGVGPIGWDVDGGDWACWHHGHTPEACAQRYLKEVERVGRGIVLLHDSIVDVRATRLNNSTLRLLEILIPRLQDGGYRFVRLDAIPTLRAMATAPFIVALAATNGRYLSPEGGEGGWISAKAADVGSKERLTVEYLAPGKIALKTFDGLFLTPRNGGGGQVLSEGPHEGGGQALCLIPVSPSRLALRTVSGHYLTSAPGGGAPLMADATSLNRECIFQFECLALPAMSRVGLARDAWRNGVHHLARTVARLLAKG